MLTTCYLAGVKTSIADYSKSDAEINDGVYPLCGRGHRLIAKKSDLFSFDTSFYLKRRMGADSKSEQIVRQLCDCKSKGRGKAKFSKPRICPHYNHAICYPDSAKEWDYGKNHPVRPENISPSDKTKRWWTCSNENCNMSYDQRTSARGKQGQRCPYCVGQSVCDQNSLATMRPDIAAEWDHKRNGELNPARVTAHSGRKVWWICNNLVHAKEPEGIFHYQSTISNRTNNGAKCSFCARWGRTTKSHEEFLEKARNIHGDKYEYLEEYKGRAVKISARCLEKDNDDVIHGIFQLIPTDHYRGSGCPKCNHRYNVIHGGHDFFMKRAKEIHGDKYEYPDEYIDMSTKLRIKCNSIGKDGELHGIFYKAPSTLIHQKSGCPKCTKELTQSIKATEISNILEELGYVEGSTIISEWSDSSRLRYKNPLHVDKFLRNENLIIEIDGSQHFYQRGYYSKLDDFVGNIVRDLIKDKYCLEHKISLLRIPFDMVNCKDLIEKAISLCKSGHHIYFSYKHHYDELIKIMNLDPQTMIFHVPSPGLRFKKPKLLN